MSDLPPVKFLRRQNENSTFAMPIVLGSLLSDPIGIDLFEILLIGFHPGTVLFRPGSVNQRACLCGVPVYASAQSLDFLARTKNPSFSN